MNPLADAMEELIALGVEGPALVAALRRLEAATYGDRIKTLEEAVEAATERADAEFRGGRAGQPLNRSMRDDRVWVYVIGVDHPDDVLVKVGISKHPNFRMATLEKERGYNLYLVHTEGPFSRAVATRIERRAHGALLAQREKGEWFLCGTDRAVEVVRTCAASVPQ